MEYVLNNVQQSSKTVVYPSNWNPQNSNCQLFTIKTGTKEYEDVLSQWTHTVKNSTIVKIERVQNKWLWEKYQVMKVKKNNKNKK